MDNKNQPAFPIVESNVRDGHSFMELRYEGFSKREYFAGLAMQGICANQEYAGRHSNSANQIAHKSVEIADALLNELNK